MEQRNLLWKTEEPRKKELKMLTVKFKKILEDIFPSVNNHKDKLFGSAMNFPITYIKEKNDLKADRVKIL